MTNIEKLEEFKAWLEDYEKNLPMPDPDLAEFYGELSSKLEELGL